MTSHFAPEFFSANRARLREKLLPGSLAMVVANERLSTSADADIAIVPNSDLFYLTGVEQEKSRLLLFPDADDERQREILFLTQPSEEEELWAGHKLSKEEARALSGIDNIQWLPEFPRLFHRLMCECEHVYLNSNEHKRAAATGASSEDRRNARTIELYPLHHFHRLAPIMHRLRAVKAEAEVAALRRACALTDQGFRRALRVLAPGVSEAEIEAEFAHEFIRHRAQFAYSPIVASGNNALCLHYGVNSAVCRKGELLLLDVGARWANYNADMTRAIPVSGRFSRRQRQVYNAVLRVLRQSIQGLVAGKKSREWQREGEQMIEKELVDLGLLTMAGLKKQDPLNPAFRKFFMHGLGHPLGLDVHDVGITTEPFQNGWVMTVEPALYIRDEGIGVRLENDVLITGKGPVDLMAGIPIEADEIESLMAEEPAA